jgi:hypothetical protein
VGAADRRWAHCTPSLNGLSYRFAVRSDDARLGTYAERVLSGLRGEGPVEHWYSLTMAGSWAESGSESGSGSDVAVDVDVDGSAGVRARRPADALAWVVWHANQAAAESGRAHLLFHAAGVCVGAGGGAGGGACGVLMPGASGSGKSTLSAGLVRAGLSYLSDELVALSLDPAGGRLLPYAKPITVKPGSFGVLRGMGPGSAARHGGGVDDDGTDELWAGEEWLLPVGTEEGRPVAPPCAPRFVVVPRYEAGALTELSPLSETEAFVALAVNAVNFRQHGEAGVRALGDLVTRCECAALTMSDLDDACGLVLDFVAAAPTAEGAGRAR